MLYPKRRWYPHAPAFCRWFCWVGCRLIGRLFGLKSEGLEHLAKGPALIIAPHVNFLDPIFALATMPRPPRFIGDAFFTFSNPLLAWVMWLAGVVPVDRSRPDPYALRQYLRLMSHGELCVLFPEGARSLHGEVMPPMTQAVKLIAKLKIPVATVALEGAYDSWPRWDPQIRQPWGRVRVRFVEMLKTGESPRLNGKPQDVYDRRRGIDVESERREIRRSLDQAARGEPEATVLTRRGRPQAVPRLLCFCPECAQPSGLAWNHKTKLLTCSRCLLELRVLKHGLAARRATGDETPRSIAAWFHQMQNALRNKNSEDLTVASKVSARVRENTDESDAPFEPASVRIDQHGLAFRNSQLMLHVPLKFAAKGSTKGSDVLDIPYAGRQITLISDEGHAVTWLILIRRLAGWPDYFSEV
ncbi:MAG: 1-acyl-sn-glycerol-3-phosphate acyltransferase [Elusimicrobia bacterium]|nr:1-acyl-sn-glycerol-3-phosphate acyltransferase [Elusimicrobiota bacterium]